jgi:hypothetical protein
MLARLHNAAQAVDLPQRPWWPLVPLGLLSVTAMTVLGLRPGSWRDEPLLFSLLALAIGVAALAGTWIARTRRLPSPALGWILAVGVVLNLLALGLSPSDDANRYIVEGRQILAGDNPYRIPPADPRAGALVDPAISAAVNHPQMTAIYPPLALAFHALAQVVGPGVLGLKLLSWAAAVLACGLALILLVRWGRPPGLVVALAWNPLLAIFASGEVHHDIIMAVLVLVTLLCATAQRPALATVALALAILVKPFAAVVVPFLARVVPWRRWWLLPATVIVAYLPFAGAGGQLFASTATFAGTMHFHGAIDPWVRMALTPWLSAAGLEPAVRVVLVGLLLGGLGLLWRWRRDYDLPTLTISALVLLLLCLPTLHPWYLLVIAGLLPFTRSWGLVLWTAGAGVYWLHGIAILRQHGAWSETLWVTALAHLPAVAVLAVEVVADRLRRHRDPSHG